MNWSWSIYELIKALEIKTSTVYNLVFANNTIVSCLFFLFLDNWLIILISPATAQISSPTAELAIRTRTPTNEANGEIEIHPR